MYVMVFHQIANPEMFWKKAPEILATMPTDLTLHHTFSTPEGSNAVCIWEAPAVEHVQNLLKPNFAGISIDTYLVANNKDGVVIPPQFQEIPVGV